MCPCAALHSLQQSANPLGLMLLLLVMCTASGRVSSGMGMTPDGGTSPTDSIMDDGADGCRGLPQSGHGLEIKV